MNKKWKETTKKILWPSINRIEKHFDSVNTNIAAAKNDIRRQDTRNVEALIYQAIHQKTLDRLRVKFKSGEKIHVCFLVVSDGKFVFDTIYKEMEQSNYFIPECLLIHKKDYDFDLDERYYKELQEQYQELASRGYKVNIAYDDSKHPIPFDEFDIDILFLFASYLDIEPCYFKDSVISAEFLTCFVNYAMRNVKLNDWMYNNEIVNTSWINFVESYDIYKEFMKRSYFGGKNIVVAGYPKLDNYVLDIGHSNFPFSLYYEGKTVVYAPHWSMYNKGWLNISTFHLYYDYFEKLMEQYPDIRFVFKPHPDIGLHLRKLEKKGIQHSISSEDYERYVQRWEEHDNGFVYMGSDYITLFKHTDCLITDCGSFTSEWMPSKKPCIYLINPENDKPLDIYNDLGRKILDSYYCCNNRQEIESAFQNVVVHGNDSKYGHRMDVLDRHFVNIGTSGKYITEILYRRLSK